EDQLAHLGVILAEDPHDFLGLRGFRERGEAAQIEKDNRHLATVGLERVVGTTPDDELGEVWGEEALEAAEAVDHLVRPRVVDGGGGLIADDAQAGLVKLVE